jgi:hypothetical protein
MAAAYVSRPKPANQIAGGYLERTDSNTVPGHAAARNEGPVTAAPIEALS